MARFNVRERPRRSVVIDIDAGKIAAATPRLPSISRARRIMILSVVLSDQVSWIAPTPYSGPEKVGRLRLARVPMAAGFVRDADFRLSATVAHPAAGLALAARRDRGRASIHGGASQTATTPAGSRLFPSMTQRLRRGACTGESRRPCVG
jgi:hypothetical protein